MAQIRPDVNLLPAEIDNLITDVREKRPRSLARVLSMVENGHPSSSMILHSLYNPDRQAKTIGVTGPPGAGKSTLVNLLIDYWRKLNKNVGVIAVDPSSPFSGGALLGDRIRMQTHASDPGVFIRSMGSRGHLGGLSGATRDALEVLTAGSYDPVLVETVGVGQAEVEVASLADITLLVLVPGLGDEVQTMKAGIMEIADVIVLNKADRPGIEQLETAVNASLEFMDDHDAKPPVIRCSAQTGEGVDYLTGTVDRMLSSGVIGRDNAKRRTTLILNGIIREKGSELAKKLISEKFGSIDEAIESVLSGETTPYMIGKMFSEFLEGIQEKENGSKQD